MEEDLNDVRFWDLDLTEAERKAGIKWFKEEELVGLVDEKQGGIIGYIHPKHIKKIIKKLNE